MFVVENAEDELQQLEDYILFYENQKDDAIKYINNRLFFEFKKFLDFICNDVNQKNEKVIEFKSVIKEKIQKYDRINSIYTEYLYEFDQKNNIAKKKKNFKKKKEVKFDDTLVKYFDDRKDALEEYYDVRARLNKHEKNLDNGVEIMVKGLQILITRLITIYPLFGNLSFINTFEDKMKEIILDYLNNSNITLRTERVLALLVENLSNDIEKNIDIIKANKDQFIKGNTSSDEHIEKIKKLIKTNE